MHSCIIESSPEEQRTLTARWFCWPRYVGYSILIFGRKRSYFPMQCFVGPDWPCMMITYCLILVPSGLFLVYVASQIHIAVVAVTLATFLSTCCAFSVAACSDPGIVYQVVEQRMLSKIDAIENGIPSGKRKDCSKCDMLRPLDASHCYECGICIHDLDHHCPWTGKCIGKRTMPFFNFFLGSLCLHIILVAVVTIYFFAVSGKA